MSNYSSIRSLFDSASLPIVVTDSITVSDAFAACGFDVAPLEVFASGCPAPDEAIVIVTTPLPEGTRLQQFFPRSAVLDIPLVAFETDGRSVQYLLKRLEHIDFHSVCERSREIIDLIEYCDEPFTVLSGASQLTIQLGEDVSILPPKLYPEIRRGEWVSIAQYLEVGMVPNDDCSSFNVSGELECDGVSVAHHHAYNPEAERVAKAAWDALSQARTEGGFPLLLSVEASRVTAIRTRHGEDLLEVLLPLTDKLLHGSLVEVSFASLPPSSTVDWSINSQLNEASGGVHIALGTGVDAAHIDFISSAAKLA